MSRQATHTAPPAGATAEGGGVARSPHLDASLDKAHRLAVEQRHSGVSSEHLLFALTEDAEALGVLGASTVNIERLRADITTHLAQLPGDAPAGRAVLPTADLLKVLKLAAMAAQQSARRQIDGAIVLAAMIGDASTPSAGLLRAHGLTFNEVIRVLQKGTAPVVPSAPAGPVPVQAPATQTPPTPAATPAVKETPPVPARMPSGPSTDELLASVRARLQEAAPPAPVRRVERPVAAPAQDAAKDAAPARAAEIAPEAAAAETEQRPAAVSLATAVAAVAPGPATRPPEIKPVREPGIGDIPRSPDELRPAPLASLSDRNLPPPMPRVVAAATPPQAAQVAALPPLPLVPAAAARAGPPPLPTAVQVPAVAQAPVSSAAAGVGREAPRAAPILPPSVDLKALLKAIPGRMKAGETEVIEMTVPRRAFEIPPGPGHRWPPLRVVTLRLRAGRDEAFVEPGSPETLWISPPRVHQGADDATWRWRVTPRVDGRLRLTLSGATRVVGGEGISGEAPLGEESIESDVRRAGSRRWLVGLLLFGNLIGLGLIALTMSGRAGAIVGGVAEWVRGVFGW